MNPQRSFVAMLATFGSIAFIGCTPEATAPVSDPAPAAASRLQSETRPNVVAETTPATNTADRVSKPPASAPATHCASDEATVFSCRLDRSSDVVSLCLATSGASAGRAYYASGTVGNPALVIPAADAVNPTIRFERTPLAFAGGTGGYAYSFEQVGQVHILYSVSGDEHFERQGLMLVAGDTSAVVSDTACTPGTVVESEDARVLKAVRSWPNRAQIEKTGLPSAR